MQVLVAEPSAPLANALRKFLDGLAEVRVVTFVDEAVQLVRARPPDVLIGAVSQTFDGEVLCQQVRKLAPDTAVVLVYPPEEVEQAARRALDAGADAFLVGPLKKYNVVSVTRAVSGKREVAARAAHAERELEAVKQALADRQAALEAAERRARGGGPLAVRAAGGINTTDEAFFKKFMLVEVKRSRRYQYPVAVLLVALDGLAPFLAGAPGASRAAVRLESLQVIAEQLRDVDLAMPFADDKLLVFLPHTDRAGALVVSVRLLERLKRLVSFPGGTASIGLASFDARVEPRPQVSFGGLVREANERLRAAQEAGGDRCEAPHRRQGQPTAPLRQKKSRISMG